MENRAEAGEVAEVPEGVILEEPNAEEAVPPADGGKDSPELAEEEAPKFPECRLLFMLCAVGALEGADMVLLPCVFFALQIDLHLTLNDLALMSLVQALATNIAAPFWGVMADRGIMKRKWLIVLGCVVQGLITVVLAAVDQLLPMIILRALNGVMLASLRPIANGVVADVTAENCRGKVFGSMQFAMNLGTMAGTLVGTNLARRTVGGLQGWRVAFMLIGIASVVLGVVAGFIMKEPPRAAPVEVSSGGRRAAVAELKRLLNYFRLPSFCVLVLQGCFGSVPWNALGFSTLFFQIGGLSDLQASVIQVFQQIAGSLGSLLGGAISDLLTKWSRHHGRPLTAQISVLSGIPVAWFLFMQSPPSAGTFYYYLSLMVVLGLTATWCGIGVNLPILSEIVKPGNRATIMAWEGALEGSCSAIFGNSMVGFLAQNVFGYDIESARAAGASVANDPDNVKALGSALMLVSFVPWLFCFFSYTLLHWSYPRDLKKLAMEEEKTPSKKMVEIEDAKAARPRVMSAAARQAV
uniref:Major facilitator superfamily (MFS) profile domain-containing protein n=1 Tax=Alexandrium catenella TaxID=2925 RepID=A0A7S1L9N0_ALECA|mmetsp:Transcript_108922/g.289658  ORF Transcript_108922/g.289658 Transcript_108922/m.289658 type:complete len:524 (+) Transcript_108922:1-1572(+)